MLYPTNITMAKPLSTSELQLYRVLQRANLLQYFDTFICQGGDDVQQLCEAGEEEFLEIMALVGMAAKPLHVRRLQKALQEWVTNPGLFQQPLGPHTPAPPVAAGSILASIARPVLKVEPVNHSAPMSNTMAAMAMTAASSVMATSWSPRPLAPPPTDRPPTMNCSSNPDRSSTPLSIPGAGDSDGGGGGGSLGGAGSLNGSFARSMADSPDSVNWDDRSSGSPRPDVTPVLSEEQLKAIIDATDELAKNLPEYPRKPLNLKKHINQEIEEVMNMPDILPPEQFLELVRKYAAIYGRSDKTRHKEKPMTLHEISVNEAAAQLCLRRKNLLTRREDLFPLARQVVRDSGYQYIKGHSRPKPNRLPQPEDLTRQILTLNLKKKAQMIDVPPTKRMRIDLSPGSLMKKMDPSQQLRESRLEHISKELHGIAARQQEVKASVHQAKGGEDMASLQSMQADYEALTARQLLLLTEQGEILHLQRRSRGNKYVRTNLNPGNESREITEDEDSLTFPSGSSSPHNGADYEDSTMYAAFGTNGTGCPITVGPLGKPGLKDSLLTEGLRIAQQYGMAGFAEELKDLKQESKSDATKDLEADRSALMAMDKLSPELPGSDVRRPSLNGGDDVEQDPWSREVEQDRIKQEHGQMAKTGATTAAAPCVIAPPLASGFIPPQLPAPGS